MTKNNENKNIKYYKKKKKQYKNKYFNNLNSQGIIKKKQANEFNNFNKDLPVVTINKKNNSIEENNSKYLLKSKFLINKKQSLSLENVNSLSYNNDILNELFNKFFIINFKKDTYINLINDKKFILSKLNLI